MNFNWYDAWPFMLLIAALWLAASYTSTREWWARRSARRRARCLCAPEPDFTGCIQRAGLRQTELHNSQNRS